MKEFQTWKTTRSKLSQVFSCLLPWLSFRMAERRRPFFLLLCISHSLAGCLTQSSFISAFLPNDGDYLATVDTFPWVVSLQDSQYTHLALGCIVSEFWILSIASCFQNRKKVLALVGITDMNARRRTQPEYLISAILRHEGFNDMTMENNIALLKTYTAIEFSDQVQPICFSSRNLAPGILENCWVSGWIHTAQLMLDWPFNHGTPGETRARMEMGILKKLPVQEVWPCSLKRPWGTACCSPREEDNTFRCLGDPGNLVMCQAKKTSLWILSGILNKGGMSCSGPFLYTKLSYYGDWISKRIMKEGVNLCPIFRWQELPFTPSKLLKSPQAFSIPPPSSPREIQSKIQTGQAHSKPTPIKKVTSLKGKQASESPELEYQENKVERAGLGDSVEPMYYDYYSGEVMPISGQDRLREAREVISLFCVLTLLFGNI
ncbi:inactive serine protease 54 [Macrotis lagotis]|uniref:inactive serine protease 54 n=1 Tax=Macrotis lagotis TaxID=92651 RepID=UPI003D6804A6